jgi:carbonic anhydrase/acetyltransferase-like protein (isoleucine patch superfamily)
VKQEASDATVGFEELETRVQPVHGLLRDEWHQHPYGGGWVQNTARVDPTAYIAPEALVLGRSRVLGRACVLDQACIKGNATVAGHAKVCEQARVSDSAHLSGTCFVTGTALIRGQFTARAGVFADGDHQLHRTNAQRRRGGRPQRRDLRRRSDGVPTYER